VNEAPARKDGAESDEEHISGATLRGILSAPRWQQSRRLRYPAHVSSAGVSQEPSDDTEELEYGGEPAQHAAPPVGYPDDTLEWSLTLILGHIPPDRHQATSEAPDHPIAADGQLDSGAAFRGGARHARPRPAKPAAGDGKRSEAAAAAPDSAAAERKGLVARALRRLGWGVADQAMSSLSNSVISIYAARSLPAAEFGAFSLAYVTYAFALNASRGLATDPLVVRFSGADRPTWQRAVASSSGTAAVVGLVAGACVLGVAALLSGTAALAFLALGLTLPGLLLQDSWRYSFFAFGKGGQAFLNDSIWVVALLGAVILIRATHHVNVFWFVLVWGMSGSVAAAAGPIQARVLPRLSGARSWVTAHRDLGLRYLAENTANSSGSQLRSYGVGLIVGLAAVGYVQAASTLMGPFMVIFMGLSLVTVPEAARILRRSPKRLRLFCLLVGGGLAFAAIAWGSALLVVLPLGFGHWLLGPIWHKAYPVILPTTAGLAGACFIAGASAGLRAMGASRRSLPTQIVSTVCYVAAALIGAALDGAVGAVCGTAGAIWIGAALWWWQLHVAMREYGATSEIGLTSGRRRRTDRNVTVPRAGPIATSHDAARMHPIGDD
jgi:O-antigen/teichoic acid export membrane protein